jgi:hypothetical protein
MAKPRAKKKTKAKKAPAKKQPAAKPKKAAAKPKKKAAVAKKTAAAPAAQSEIEAKVAALLKSSDDGDIDNVYDIISELQEYDEQLPKTSPLRPEWNAFVASCSEIMMNVPLGDG